MLTQLPKPPTFLLTDRESPPSRLRPRRRLIGRPPFCCCWGGGGDSVLAPERGWIRLLAHRIVAARAANGNARMRATCSQRPLVSSGAGFSPLLAVAAACQGLPFAPLAPTFGAPSDTPAACTLPHVTALPQHDARCAPLRRSIIIASKRIHHPPDDLLAPKRARIAVGMSVHVGALHRSATTNQRLDHGANKIWVAASAWARLVKRCQQPNAPRAQGVELGAVDVSGGGQPMHMSSLTQRVWERPSAKCGEPPTVQLHTPRAHARSNVAIVFWGVARHPGARPWHMFRSSRAQPRACPAQPSRRSPKIKRSVLRRWRRRRTRVRPSCTVFAGKHAPARRCSKNRGMSGSTITTGKLLKAQA